MNFTKKDTEWDGKICDATVPNLRREKKHYTQKITREKTNKNTRHNKHTTYFNKLNFESSQGKNWAHLIIILNTLYFFSYLYVITGSKSNDSQLKRTSPGT